MHMHPPHTHTHTGIHECSVLNHGCGGDETLCLISNSLDGVCQCPANMFKQVHQDPAGQNIGTCRSELHQYSCHILTPSHLHTRTLTPTLMHILLSILIHLTLITPSQSHTHPHAHSLTCLPSSTLHSHPLTPSPPHSLAGADSLLLIATQEAIHYLPIHTNISPGIPRPLPIGPLYDVSAVAYDPFNKSVLWIDRETQFLNR